MLVLLYYRCKTILIIKNLLLLREYNGEYILHTMCTIMNERTEVEQQLKREIMQHGFT
jgi:hypothetical protein